MSIISLMDNIAGDIPLEKNDSWRIRWHTLRNVLIDIEAYQTKEELQNMVHFNCVRCGKQLHIAENIFIIECPACKTQYSFYNPAPQSG